MSVLTEVDRIKSNVLDALEAVANYGVTVPSTAKSDDLPTLINSIIVQKYYTGTSEPTSTLGENGDIYLLV